MIPLRPVLTVFCLLMLVRPADAGPTGFEGLTVTGITLKDDHGDPWQGTDQISELINVKPGDVFSGAAIRRGLELLYLKGAFRNIRVDGFPDRGGVRLEYTFSPVTLIDSIVVRGNSALSSTLISESLPRLEGRELREDKLPGLKADLVALYQAHGFFDAEVSFRVERLRTPHRVAIHIDIAEGTPTIIRDISFTGVTVFTDRQLRAVMKSRVGKPADRDLLLDHDKEAIQNKYEAAGYPAAKPGPVNVRFEGHDAFVTLAETEGPHVSVLFRGNKEFSSSKLRQTLLIWTEHDISDSALEGSAEKIKELYRDAGYPDVAVEIGKKAEQTELALTFAVTEGPRVAVGSIEFSGNTAFSTAELKSGMALRGPGWFSSPPFREDLLARDIDSLRDRFIEAGFLSATVKRKVVRSADGKHADIRIDITEGSRTMTGAITFEGNTAFSAAELLSAISLRPGAPYNERLVDDDRYNILTAYSNKGYLYARVDAEKTARDGAVDIRYRIIEDKPVSVGRIILRGNERTKDYVIMREFTLKQGDAYDYGAMLTSQQRIYHLGYFSIAKFEPVHPAEREYVKDLLFTVEERPAGYGEIAVGYGDLDRLRASVEAGYRNLWGDAEYTSVRYEESDILKRAIFNYKKPWFLNRRIDAVFSLVWSDAKNLNSDTREIYYQTRKTTATFGIEKTIEQFKPSISYQFENVVNYNVKSQAELTPEDSGRVLVSSLNPALIWDLRDDVFNPHKGALFGFVIKEATRLLWSQADFTKLTVQGSVFLPVGTSVVALSGRGGWSWPYSNTSETPIHERFYAGGSTTVRGYTQDSIGPGAKDASGNLIPQGGQSMAIFNAEFRVNPGEGLGFVLFSDAGNVWPGRSIDLHDLRASYGAGIRYGTPIGPLRIDYGQKIHRRSGESPGELHFNIGNTF